MARFTIPREIYFGAGAIGELENLRGRRAFVVTGGSSMQKGGFLDKTRAALEKAGFAVRLYEGVENDPAIETVMTGAKAMEAFSPDVIVALGGGSPMDAAKAMWFFYEHPEKSFDDIKQPFSMPPLREKARFVAIPSTSGSASEVTAFSVITDGGIKFPLASFEITPDIAILDTDLPQTMPATLTAHTGMDALTHALEAYVATARSPFSDALALRAAMDIYDSLLASYHGDAAARGAMHLAQCLAGMAFSNALLGISHSLAHKTGAVFGLTHGCCNAILLPYVIAYNARDCAGRYAEIARARGLCGGTERQLTDALIESICALNRSLGIAQTYRENGVSEALFAENADSIAKNAVDDPCTGSNPRPIDVPAMKKLLTCAYTGDPVTF